MQTSTRANPSITYADDLRDRPMAVKKLMGSGWGGRRRFDEAPDWTLDYCRPSKDDSSVSDTSDDDSSEGSCVTVIDLSVELEETIVPTTTTLIDDCKTKKKGKKRKAPDDCHVILLWSELENLVKCHMACTKCGYAITEFNRRTVGIATEIEFSCPGCDNEATAKALRSNYVDVVEKYKSRSIKNYELNWRLVLATQLMGEGQVGGSIVDLMLDLSRETFRNSWAEMEDCIGSEEARIGARVADSNLRKETMGKVAVLCNGVAKYPVAVSYDMGWQKAARTYDSMTGQGLMIGCLLYTSDAADE